MWKVTLFLSIFQHGKKPFANVINLLWIIISHTNFCASVDAFGVLEYARSVFIETQLSDDWSWLARVVFLRATR